MLDFSQFEWLTFDCYGTLIDWEAGILSALRPVIAAHTVTLPDSEILEHFGEFEAQAEAGQFTPYREVLETVVRAFGQRLGFCPSLAETRSLPESLGDWPPFSDTVEALRRLRTRYRLAIISNVDDDLLALTAKQLQVPFDAVSTAQQARSYKPSLNNFQMALEKMGAPREKILHVAQSLYHDIAPANQLGMKCVWVNRRADQPGTGATKKSDAIPDLEVFSLQALTALAVGSRSSW